MEEQDMTAVVAAEEVPPLANSVTHEQGKSEFNNEIPNTGTAGNEQNENKKEVNISEQPASVEAIAVLTDEKSIEEMSQHENLSNMQIVSENTEEQSEPHKKLTIDNVKEAERRKRRQAREEKREARQKLQELREERKRQMDDMQLIIFNEDQSEHVLSKKRSLLLRRTYDQQALLELEEISSTESYSSSSDSEHITRRPCSVSFKQDFLAHFDISIRLSEISEDETEDVVVELEIQPKAEVVRESEDVGHFVDPLTGETISSSSESDQPVDDRPDDQDQEEQEEQEEEESSELDLVDEPEPIAPDISEPVVDFLLMMEKSFENMRKLSTDLADSTKTEREVRQITTDFLFDLINRVVNIVEHIDKNVVLSKNLCKDKLMEQLRGVTENYIAEKQINTSINAKVVEYCKRTKAFRLLQTLKSSVERKEQERYYCALDQLDHFKILAADAKKKNAFLMSSVLMDLTHIQNISTTAQVELENTIYEGLVRTKDSDHIKRLIEHEFKLMRKLRNEISDTRAQLITRGHTLARLEECTYKFEQITDDLKMSKFITTQHAVVTLGKKLEERNNDLRKMRSHYHNELHYLSHIREKSQMIATSLKYANIIFNEMSKKQAKLREYLFQIKVERGRIRKQHREITFQGGLLATPTLMFDYDVTLEKVEQKRESVSKLKETFRTMMRRISDAEQQFRANSSIKPLR